MDNDDINKEFDEAELDSDSDLSELDTIPMEFVDQRLCEVRYVKNLIEGILLMSPEPIEVNRIAKSLGIKKSLVSKVAEELKQDYRERGIIILEIGEGLCLGTNPDIAENLEKFFQLERRRRISRAALQTLSIIAYNQPVTRAEIEAFRGGINSSGVIQSLLERELIKIAGKKETPGTPYLFSVSDEFLRYFGLKSIDELKEKLPAIEDEIAKDGGVTQLKLKELGIKPRADLNMEEGDTEIQENLAFDDTSLRTDTENSPDSTTNGSGNMSEGT